MPRLTATERRRLEQALLAQRGAGGWIEPGGDRWRLSESLLRRL